MLKLKYIILFLLYFATIPTVNALDIEYGSILSVKNLNVLIQYYNIGQKNNFICNIGTLNCIGTKKTTLNKTTASPISSSLRKYLEKEKASNITISPTKSFVAYYMGPKDGDSTRKYIIRNLKTKKEYSTGTRINSFDFVSDINRVFNFSPNGKQLTYIDDNDGVMSLYLVDMTKINKTIISKKIETGAYTITDALFYDNNTIYYVANTKDKPYVWSLYKHDLKTGKELMIESYVSYVDPIRKIDSSIVFNHLQAKGYGPEIYNTKTKKLQSFNIPNINTDGQIKNQEIIQAGSSTGILMTPNVYDTSKTYPLVIWLHGGPFRQTSYGYHPYHSYGIYDSILELLRKDNVVVLKLDYRGSFGFGRAYGESIKNNVGKGDVDDVMNAISYVQNRYHISNVYLAGNSYGGYMSLKSVAEHPSAFTGVFSINGVTDWQSLLVKLVSSIFNTQFDGLPNASNQYLYDQASIINKINNIGNQKIEIVQGQSDTTIPPWQADFLYNKLKEQNKNAVIVKYPKEDHVFKDKKNISDLCVQLFNFVGVPVDPECNN